MKRLGGLLLALLAGFLLAAVLDQREVVAAGGAVAITGHSSPASSAMPAAGDAFSEAWRLLAESDSPRSAARETLLRQWASADPQHLLRFFEGRALPDEWDDCLDVIAGTHPELVVHYARDHGSRKALELLVERIDPRKALEMLTADAGMPPELFATVGRRGTAVDPSFAGHLADLPEGPVREHFIRGAIETDLTMSRWKEACALAAELQGEKDHAARLLCEHLGDLAGWEERSGMLLELPRDLRGPVLAKLVEKMAMREDADGLHELKDFVEELADGNSDEGLARVLEQMAPSARVEVERVLAEPAEDASAE